jgi:hypothetical protein
MSDIRLHNLADELRSRGIDTDKLCVAICASEQYIGELVRVVLKDPRRIFRVQKVAADNESIRLQVHILNIDLVDSGTMTFWPVGFYKISDVSEESQIRMLGMYLLYFRSQEMQRAAESGIVIPKMETSPDFAAGLRKVT